MKLAAIALASAFALSSTYAVAATQHHKSGAKKHQTYANTYAGNPNNRGGLVGGDDPGTSPRYAQQPGQTNWNNTGWNNNGWNNNWNNSYGWNNNYGRGGNNRGGLVGGDDPGTRRP
jgi:hypothetical protein